MNLNHYIIEETVYDKAGQELTKRFVTPIAETLDESVKAGQELERKFLDVDNSAWGETVVIMSHVYIYVEIDTDSRRVKMMKPTHETRAIRATKI